MNENEIHVPTFMTEPCTMPFCKGCGHSHVLRDLNDALVGLQLDPHDVCLVSDIGCIGLVDALFPLPHTVHTTHGRSTAFATGIELADAVLVDSKLKTIVLIGDGGAMIGLLHLVNAAVLNVDVTVLLCNNFLFGMTGGQNSAFSPLDFITATTPKGNVVPPLDICNVVIDAHAKFVARKLATDKDLADTIADAIRYPGFALVEIVELCTEYGTKRNQLSGNQLLKIVEAHGQRTGILKDERERIEFGSVYRGKFPRHENIGPDNDKGFLQKKSDHRLQKQIGVVVAGSAGERIQSSAGFLCQAAVQSGLYCTQKNDNPVTQGTGFSLSELCISPGEIDYTGIDRPDAVIVVSNDGLRELVAKGTFNQLSPSTVVIADTELTIPHNEAEIIRLPLRSTCGGPKAAAAGIFAYLDMKKPFSSAGFLELLSEKDGTGKEFFPKSFLDLLKK